MSGSIERYIKWLRGNKGLVKELVCVLYETGRAFWNSLRIKSVELNAVCGTGNPAKTGQIVGMVEAARYMFAPRKVKINLKPVFDRFELDGQINAEFTLHPISIVKGLTVVFIKALFKPHLRSFLFRKICELVQKR